MGTNNFFKAFKLQLLKYANANSGKKFKRSL